LNVRPSLGRPVERSTGSTASAGRTNCSANGKLSAEWRAQHPHAEPASKLLDRILAARRRQWEADQLAKFAATGKSPPKNWQAKYHEPYSPDTACMPVLPGGWCCFQPR
jgi:type I restriction enzyme S subunit